MANFSKPYQSIYDAAVARLKESEAAQRARMLNAAARAGVQTSGVGQIPQGAISKEVINKEADLGAKVAGMEETERLQDKAVEQRKELLKLSASLSEAAAARERKYRRSLARSGIYSSLIGAGLGGVSGYLARRLYNSGGE